MAILVPFGPTRNGARFVGGGILIPTTLTAGVADTDGEWFDTLHYHPFTVVIGGQFTVGEGGGITVRVSNGVLGYAADGDKRPILVKPDNAENGFPALGPDLITAPYSVLSDGPYKYVKVQISGLELGFVTATFSAAVTVGEKG